MPTNTWPLEDSAMLPPLVLRPPHGPRIVRGLVVILALIFHVATAGWSLITNGPEGELASVALSNGGWAPPAGTALLHGPLAYWLTQGSMALFGGNELAARLPASLAVVGMIFLTLRLVERLGGTIWHGFVAALILLCSPGMFTLGRMLTPAPLTAALITATICALQRGAEHCPERRRWFLLAWIAWGFATLAGGWRAGAIPIATVMLLAGFYPAGKLRFRLLLSWEGGLLLALTLAVMTATGFSPGANLGVAPELAKPVWQILCWQFGLLFPWSLLLLPAAGSVLAQLFSLRPLEWEEALPLAWLAAGVAVMALDPVPTLFSSLLFWPAFAVWGASRLSTMHRRVFLYGCSFTVTVATGGLVLTQHLRQLLPLLFPSQAPAIAAIPDYFWPTVSPVAFIAMLAFAMFVGVAIWAETVQNRRFALLALFAAMIPAGFAFADAGAKFAPYFSEASIAGCIESMRDPRPVIFVEESRFASSSLWFYLGDSSRHDLQTGKVPTDASHWAPPMVLVTAHNRLPYWKQALESRFTVACESGEHVLLVARAEKGDR